MSVRVRFAPSPTGYLHVGGARTALFNYLFAKKNKGSFVLRVEDTDQDRNQEKALIPMLESLSWLGIDPDEGLFLKESNLFLTLLQKIPLTASLFPSNKSFSDGGGTEQKASLSKTILKSKGAYGPYRQKDRLGIYKGKALELVEQGKAYYCFMSPEEEAEQKQKAIEKEISFRVSSPYRSLELSQAREKVKEGRTFCIRFKIQEGASPYRLKDLVRGDLSFPSDSLGDFILIRSDGFPVYNFACAVDDSLMKITHVFRGEEHLSNSIKQKLIQEALGFQPPQFGHLSIILDKEKKKLSKRLGSKSAGFYKKEGYLPSALVNFLALLGWNPKTEKEFFSKKELIESFNISGLNSSSAVFDEDKLLWLNERHIKNLPEKQLRRYLKKFIKQDVPDELALNYRISLLKSNFKTLKQAGGILDLFLMSEVLLDKEVADFLKNGGGFELLKSWIDFLEKTEDDSISQERFKSFQKSQSHFKGPLFFKPLRCFMIGQKEGFEIKLLLSAFDRKQLLKRAKSVYNQIS